MAITYNKLWKMLREKGYNKTRLCKEAKISTNAMAKMGRDEEVRLDVLTRICGVLGCTLDDILDLIPEEGDHTKEEVR